MVQMLYHLVLLWHHQLCHKILFYGTYVQYFYDYSKISRNRLVSTLYRSLASFFYHVKDKSAITLIAETRMPTVIITMWNILFKGNLTSFRCSLINSILLFVNFLSYYRYYIRNDIVYITQILHNYYTISITNLKPIEWLIK